MSATQRDLKYYLEHTDEMPTDPKEIERLANEHMAQSMEIGTEPLTVDRIVGEPDDKPTDAAASEAAPSGGDKAKETKEIIAPKPDEAAAKPKDEPKGEAKADPEAKPEGVLAKDGKNVIPYAVLESARERTVAAEKLAAEQAKELEALRAAKPKEHDEPKPGNLTVEELTALEAESPTLAKLLRDQQATIQSLTGTVEAIKGRQEQRDTADAAEVKSEIQTAIDAVPELATWQAAEDQAAWNIASMHDKTLRSLPKYKDVSFEDRFKEVVKLTKLTLGEAIEPPAQTKADTTPAPTADEIRAAAEKKLAAKSAKGIPRSLSDIPGGAPPAVDEKDRIEQMSAVELGNKFLSMTPDQREAYLSGL